MTKEYVSEVNLQTAMAEYKDLRLNRIAETPNGEQIGTVTQVYDNTGHVTLPPGVKELEALTGSVTGRTMETVSGDGEQVYAVEKNPGEESDVVQEVKSFYAIL